MLEGWWPKDQRVSDVYATGILQAHTVGQPYAMGEEHKDAQDTGFFFFFTEDIQEIQRHNPSKELLSRSSRRDSVVTNPTRIPENARLIPGLAQLVKDLTLP